MADGLLAFDTPPSQRMVCTHWKGRMVGEQMATPSFQCLPRWLPPPPYLDMGEPPHVTEGSRPEEPGVYCLSSLGYPGEVIYPGQLKRGCQESEPWG